MTQQAAHGGECPPVGTKAEGRSEPKTRPEGAMVMVPRLPRPLFITSGPHLSGYRVALGYETLTESQDAHQALAATQQSPDPLDILIADAFEKMKPFCKACQATPKHGYCNMRGCPMPRPQPPADGRSTPETGANSQDSGDWTALRLAAEEADWLERQPVGVFGANDIEHRFRKLAAPRAVLKLIAQQSPISGEGESVCAHAWTEDTAGQPSDCIDCGSAITAPPVPSVSGGE